MSALRSLALIALFVIAAPTLAAPKAELWSRWQARDVNASSQVDHSAWDALLRRHVRRGPDGINRVAYASFGAADGVALDRYIRQLSATPISRFNPREQFAFWVNLYNALTIDVVLEHYPVRSIKDIDISPGLFASGPWGKKLIEVEGEAISLDDIEHRILRPIWKDPRIHYAVNCASLGCPNLLAEAFTGADFDAQLERAAREFINHPRAVTVTDTGLEISSIYRWFMEDFGDDDALIAHLRAYANPDLRRKLESVGRIVDDRYDWSVNTASGS